MNSVVRALCLLLAGLSCTGAQAQPPPAMLRMGTFSLSPAEAAQVRDALYRRWLPRWIGAGTMEIRITADPSLDRAIVTYGSGEERYDLLEVHPEPYHERWRPPEEPPLLPFLEWSPLSPRWPAARREAVLLARKGEPLPDLRRPEGYTLAIVSRHSWLGGRQQLRMLADATPTHWFDLGAAQDVLRALAVGWVDLAAVPRDPDLRWGLPYDLSHRFTIYRRQAQPPPIWVLSREWAKAYPVGKATLRDDLPQCFGEGELLRVTTLGPSDQGQTSGHEGGGP